MRFSHARHLPRPPPPPAPRLPLHVAKLPQHRARGVRLCDALAAAAARPRLAVLQFDSCIVPLQGQAVCGTQRTQGKGQGSQRAAGGVLASRAGTAPWGVVVVVGGAGKSRNVAGVRSGRRASRGGMQAGEARRTPARGTQGSTRRP